MEHAIKNSKKVTFIEYGSKKILYIDFSEASETEILELIKQAHEIIKTHPENSLLTLTNVRNTKYNPEVVEALKDYTKANKPFVKAAAIIGLNRIKMIIYNSVMSFSGRDLKSFDDVKKAKDWLATQ